MDPVTIATWLTAGGLSLLVIVGIVRAINRPEGRQTYERPNIKYDPCPAGTCSSGFDLGLHENDQWVIAQREQATEARHRHEQAQIASKQGTWSLPVNPHVEYEILTPGESQQVPQLGRGEETGEWVKIGQTSWEKVQR